MQDGFVMRVRKLENCQTRSEAPTSISESSLDAEARIELALYADK